MLSFYTSYNYTTIIPRTTLDFQVLISNVYGSLFLVTFCVTQEIYTMGGCIIQHHLA